MRSLKSTFRSVLVALSMALFDLLMSRWTITEEPLIEDVDDEDEDEDEDDELEGDD